MCNHAVDDAKLRYVRYIVTKDVNSLNSDVSCRTLASVNRSHTSIMYMPAVFLLANKIINTGPCLKAVGKYPCLSLTLKYKEQTVMLERYSERSGNLFASWFYF